ncbi:AAA family ATPase, partial [Clostridium butyricum]|uniref:AAA family ATPase n=1 Tax=Clostridium butyricum TaxID=1492 RepID=UPI0028FD7086
IIIVELIYLWIENYKDIKEQGISFTKKYNVIVDDNYQKYNLQISKNEDTVDSILFGNNINISAIVGNNGVGKSTLLDLIRIMLFDPKRLRKRNIGFSIWKQGKNFRILKFVNKAVIVNTVEIKELVDNDEFNLVYYSDSLDIKHYDDDFDDGENIETTIGDIIVRERDRSQYNVSTAFLLKHCNNINDKIREFIHNEVGRQFTFYSDDKIRKVFGYDENETEEEVLKIPSQLAISIKFLSPYICDKVLDDHLDNYTSDQREGRKGGNYTTSITIELLHELKDFYNSIVKYRNYQITKNINSNSLDDIICWNLFIIYIYMLLNEREDTEKDDYSYIDKQLEKIIDKFNNCEYKFEFCKYFVKKCENMGEFTCNIISEFYKYLNDFK